MNVTFLSLQVTFMSCKMPSMGKKQDLKQIVLEMASRVGKLKAHELLLSEKVAPSTATKLLRGSYPSEIGELLGAAILRADEKARQVA
jgi:hypothetical protein